MARPAPKPEPRETGKTKDANQKGRSQAWKRDERDTARLYQEIDGETENPVLKRLITRTKEGEPIGRLGHLTALQVDSCSRSYMIESKRRSLPVWIHSAWVQIQQRARDYGLHPVLVCTLVPEQAKMEYEGKQVNCEDLHIITSSRHAELLEKERRLAGLEAA